MLSRHTSWDRTPSRFVRGLHDATVARSIAVDLTESNPTGAGLSHPPTAVAALGERSCATYDPEPLGMASARQAVADHHGGVDRERVWLTASTSEACCRDGVRRALAIA